MIKITAVSYINTLPFIYGIFNSGFLSEDEYVLERKIPSLCTKAFLNKESEIVLVPSGSIRTFHEAEIITNYGIASYKHVKSVLLVSNSPLKAIKHIVVDYQSTTSILLLKILSKYYWKIDVNFEKGSEGFENNLDKYTAALIIGDRAMELASYFKYVFDLSYHWWKFTKLPFVFAFWTKTKEVNTDFLNRFNLAIQWGVEHKLESLKSIDSSKHNVYSKYLNHNIRFNIQSKEIEGLKLFYEYLKY